MGYITKKELIEQFKSEGIFTTDELTLVNKSLDKDKLNDEAILKLDVITLFEQKGILKRFYDFCKKRNYFPKWLKNVEAGLDKV